MYSGVVDESDDGNVGCVMALASEKLPGETERIEAVNSNLALVLMNEGLNCKCVSSLHQMTSLPTMPGCVATYWHRLFAFHGDSSHTNRMDAVALRPASWSYFYQLVRWSVAYVVYRLDLKEQLWILSAAIFKGFFSL